MQQITVSRQFIDDFNLVTERTGITGADQDAMRKAVRSDFDNASKLITETAAVYRFCDDTWRGLHSVELCRGYLASLGWYPQDETYFERFGIMLIVRQCWLVKNAVDARLVAT